MKAGSNIEKEFRSLLKRDRRFQRTCERTKKDEPQKEREH